MTEIDDQKTPVVLDPISISKFKISCLAIAAFFSSVGCAILIEKIGFLYKLPLEFVEMPMNLLEAVQMVLNANKRIVRWVLAFR